MSTVDFSGAYSGLATYSKTYVGALTILIIEAGPIMALLSTLSAFCIDMTDRKRQKLYVATASTISFAFLVSASAVLILMRSHLFVWTVFAPRWVYEVMGCFSSCIVVFLYTLFL